MAKKPDTDSPVSDYNGLKGPGSALSMPVKHYPSTDKLGDHSGKGNTIDSPAKTK